MNTTIASILTATFAVGTAGAQPPPQSLQHPQAAVRVKVIDEAGKPLTAAKALVAFFDDPDYGGDGQHKYTAFTTAEGIANLSMRAPKRFAVGGEKPGYYRGVDYIEFVSTVNDRWEPWNPEIAIHLRQLREPIAMHAKRVELRVPAKNAPIAFDLMIGDWVSPHGRGKNRDLVFTETHEERGDRKTYGAREFDHRLRISFSNPADGIQVVSLPKPLRGSTFRSPHTAPEDGYLPEWMITRTKKAGAASKSDADPQRVYCFRVRSALDATGKLQSALYGKIYGDFPNFRYYLNPSAGSRNIEFDPKRNLFTDLKSDEMVYEP